MPKRWRTNSRGTSKYSPSRKVAKKRFITVKNKCRDPEVGHGLYYSYHVHQEPMCWIDIYFPSTKYKGRYFSAALTTLEYDGWNQDEERARVLADNAYPNEWLEMDWEPIPRTNPKHEKYYSTKFSKSEKYDEKRELEKALQQTFAAHPRAMRASIRIDHDYWYPAIGLHASLNTPSLTPQVINEFIEMFRSLGEPITQGLVWEGEEVQVVPGKLEERNAQSSSD